MKEFAEFRVWSKYASQFLPPDCGKDLGSVRKVVVPVGSPVYNTIKNLARQLPTSVFAGWNIIYKYSRNELDCANLLLLQITPTACFEPGGEKCGTQYDDSDDCALCGAGGRQVSDLVLDLRRAPKKKDIARTIADEWIVSQALAELIVDNKVTGCELRPVKHKAYHSDRPLKLSTVPSGRELLQRAELAGIVPFSWEFWVWLGRPEQRELNDRADVEHCESLERRASKAKPPPLYYQLVITSPRVSITPPSRFGINPFNEDARGECRCPLGHTSGHVIGLNRLSELSISRSDWSGSDIACTASLVGARRGLLRPRPLILISPRFRDLLINNKIKGFSLEVAYFGEERPE